MNDQTGSSVTVQIKSQGDYRKGLPIILSEIVLHTIAKSYFMQTMKSSSAVILLHIQLVDI